ncbi:KinB-signaling pathway activation protein [Bacillus sp. WMMC1349]|uniref:KinB-signaling pathway activation protein n=1 Tax=Bacillus sp. WMMC1349 TaxID=2736254 RepID=UPI001552B9F7|nr:KinB-signaling pathway activation protein [Bacillus sp. WMMC1349]NPC90734.1 KinB-signaling pathway activation protein [Bacillus sp. WMMC1349]NPC91272.1 KinB-signaling pathway activation protein [Bacillus sp. WMMC1349]
MKSRDLVRFFFSVLGIGAITTSIVGFAVEWGRYKELFLSFEVLEILSVLIWFIGVGMIFSVIAQMGFVIFLTIHRFALEIFRSHSLWNSIQLFLILFVTFDLVYLRFLFFETEGGSLIPYLWFPLFILVVGVGVAFLKQKQSSKKTFISALFLMVVYTIMEWFPALRVNEEDWLYFMLFPLLSCNAFQLLMLPRFQSHVQ